MSKTRTVAYWGIGVGTATLILIGILLIIRGMFSPSWINFTDTSLGVGIIILTLFASGFWSLRLFTKK